MGSKPKRFPLCPKAEKADIPAWRQSRRKSSLLLMKWPIFFPFMFQLIGWSPPTLERAICFIQCTDSNINLIQRHLHRNTQNNVWPNIWAPCSLVKLTQKINHHIKQFMSVTTVTSWNTVHLPVWLQKYQPTSFHIQGNKTEARGKKQLPLEPYLMKV